MERYNYTIKSVDTQTLKMVVEYSPEDSSLNTATVTIPVPDRTVDIEVHINLFAPQDQWEKEKSVHSDLQSYIGVQGNIDPLAIAASISN
jgi:hypothetical protein